MSQPLLSIILVSYNTEALLRECLASVYAHTHGCSFEVIVVDNASQDGSVAMLRNEFPAVRCIEAGANLGFGAGNNLGAAQARGDYLLFLNSDTVLLEDTAAALLEHLQKQPGVACVGPRILWPDGRLQPQAFGHLPSPWRLLMQACGGQALGLAACEGVDGRHRRGPWQDVGWLSGVCIALRREHFAAVGGFDPRFFMYAEDVALCGRLARFGKIRLIDAAGLRHYGGASSPRRDSRIRNAVWQQRHILQVCADEFGRPALHLGRLAVGLGLLLRCAAGLLRIPRQGLHDNLLLAASLARLGDLCGRRRIPERPASPLATGNLHAHRH